MFKRITRQIKTLDEKRQILDADWEATGNHSLLNFHVKIMPQLIDAERCSIFIQDPMQESVWLKAGTGVEEEEIELSLDDGSIVSNVIATGDPTIIHGLNEAEAAQKNIHSDAGFVAKNIMCIPIKSLDGKEITGAIQLLNKKADEKFSDEDLDSLEEMAHYLEWSLENIRYHAEAKEILESIYSVLTKIVMAAVAMLVLVSPILMLWGFPYIAKFFSGGM
ncbi:MAG: GAF domain-containing protein [Gammaproteobacteria bacterium]|nr:GAF domain-containing protein [Gammaproteobacteria bacterium]